MIWLVVPAPAETAIEAWVQQTAGGPPVFVRVDADNNIVVAGSGGSYTGGFLVVKYSNSGSPLWTNRYDYSANSTTYPSGLAVDRSNNIIVTGPSRTFGGGYDFDYATVKFSSAGVPLWTNRYSGNAGSTSASFASGVAADQSDNIVVTGTSQGDVVTIQYSSEGVALWTNRYDALSNDGDQAGGLAMDCSGNIIVVGTTTGADISSNDFLTVKYSGAGVPLWTNSYNGPANSWDTGSLITADRSNNVCVAGQSAASATYPYNPDWAIVKYSDAGVVLWTNRYAQALDDSVWALVSDSGNNVVVAGSCGSDYVTIRYSNAGAPLWTNRYSYGPVSPLGNDYPRQAMAVDRSNNVAVAGFSKSGTPHFETIKYASAGAPLWTNRYYGMGDYDNRVQAAACDANDDVIVVGFLSNAAQGPLGVTTYELVAVKYGILRPPVLRNIALTNGAFQLCAEGYALPGKLVIEASSNLLEWLPVFTNSATSNLTFYSDADSGNLPARFYRAVLLP